MINKKINIGIVGLGQIGSRLFKEINSKKKDISIKTGKEVNILAISAKNIKKKRNYKFNKKIFYKNPLLIAKNPKIDVLFDDTEEHLSAKFKKFDLIGIPYQIILGSKSTKDNFEFKEINGKTEKLSLEEIKNKLINKIKQN